MKNILEKINFPQNLSIDKRDDLLEFFIKINQKAFLSFYKNEQLFSKTFQKVYNDLNTWVFPTDWKFMQKLYHYLHNDKELKLGKCAQCGKRTKFFGFIRGYNLFCSVKCSSMNKDRWDRIKQTNIKKYGAENPFQSDICKEKIKETNLKNLGVENPSQSRECQEKKIATCIKKYGVDNYAKSNESKEKYKQLCQEKWGVNNSFQAKECKEKIKETCIEKYGVDYYVRSETFKEQSKQTCLETYGYEYYQQTQEFLDRTYNTRKRNNTFCSSNAEIGLMNWLNENGYTFVYQYVSELYPYKCDFYLPDYNLYVEIQGCWTHGGHPFDENNKNDIKKLEDWKLKNSNFYMSAIDTWTNKDVIKRNVARENNLNYLEIFSKNPNVVISTLSNYLKSAKNG